MAETDQSAGAGERRYFPAVLGWTVLAASTVTLIQFLLSFNYLKFWTFHWGISIFFIIGLFAAGVAMLHLSSLGRLRLTEIIFGVFYSILAVLIYVFMGYFQSFHHLAPADFFGYATLLVIAGGMGGKARQLLEERGVEVVVGVGPEAPETIVGAYLSGTLTGGANLCDH